MAEPMAEPTSARPAERRGRWSTAVSAVRDVTAPGGRRGLAVGTQRCQSAGNILSAARLNCRPIEDGARSRNISAYSSTAVALVAVFHACEAVAPAAAEGEAAVEPGPRLDVVVGAGAIDGEKPLPNPAVAIAVSEAAQLHHCNWGRGKRWRVDDTRTRCRCHEQAQQHRREGAISAVTPQWAQY